MKLSFTLEERRSVYCIAKAMILADNKVDNNEMKALVGEFIRLGSTPEELQQIEANDNKLNPTDAIATIAEFNPEQKRYVSAMLLTMMIVDGDIDESENKLLCFVSTLCGLPNVSVDEAFKYMSSLGPVL